MIDDKQLIEAIMVCLLHHAQDAGASMSAYEVKVTTGDKLPPHCCVYVITDPEIIRAVDNLGAIFLNKDTPRYLDSGKQGVN